MMTQMPSMKLRNTEVQVPIIQGGMGIGLSSYTLAGAVAREGGLGVLSSAGLDRIVAARQGKKLMKAREAAAQDVRDAKTLGKGGAVGMNIMVAVINQYEDSVLGSMDGGVDAIISGAGLPMALPEIALRHERNNDVALIPIVSSGRAMEVIFKRWKRTGRLPDAVVVEGPRAGGHIAWREVAEALAPENHLDNLLKEVFEVVKDWGNIPVVAAGGVYTHDDIKKYLEMGCAGVQMGTRFLATYESGANAEYKKMLVECKEEDIELASKPGSPCGMLFHVIKQSPFYQQAVARERAPKCDKGYLLNKGHCPSKHENEKTFCICNGLLASIDLNNQNEKNLYTVGANAHRIDRIMSVHELMAELQGKQVSAEMMNLPVEDVRAHQRVSQLG
ncbi:NAD(P)H-dependent flavin oxidoreductase [Bdellovibrio sp. HCB337]|uniref:NAD(P)H-dependent flavin oxidoreductase n=1 Tax=Bdellovibrio sp. HCB337 TaxID=3394358 RepID=UPI0039A469D8